MVAAVAAAAEIIIGIADSSVTTLGTDFMAGGKYKKQEAYLLCFLIFFGLSLDKLILFEN